jgi:FkbM family methyltransferase
MRIRLEPESGSSSNFVYFGELFEHDEMSFVKRYLRPGDRVLDGGANIGGYTLLAASIVGPTGRVDCFEPEPETAAWLRQNVALNGLVNVAVHEKALGFRAAPMTFTADRDVSNSIVTSRTETRATVTVQCVSLDTALDSDVHYALWKLDLEGAEVDALRGAATFLRRGNPSVLLVECIEGQLAKFDQTGHDLRALLEQAGYEFAVFNAATGKLAFEAVEGASAASNLIAVHKGARGATLQRLTQASASRRAPVSGARATTSVDRL